MCLSNTFAAGYFSGAPFQLSLQLFASNDKSLGREATKCMALPVQYRHKWFSLAFLDCLVEQFNKTF